MKTRAMNIITQKNIRIRSTCVLMLKTVLSIINTSNMINLCVMAIRTANKLHQKMIMNQWANTTNLTLTNLISVAIVLLIKQNLRQLPIDIVQKKEILKNVELESI